MCVGYSFLIQLSSPLEMSYRFPSADECDPEIQIFECVHEHMTTFVVLTM